MKTRYQLQVKYDGIRSLTRCRVLAIIIASFTGWLTGCELAQAATVPTMMQTYHPWSRTGAESRKLTFAGGNDRLRASLLGPSRLLKT